MATIQLPKAPIATDWVTAADIGGTGTAAVESAGMTLLIPTDGMMDWCIEIQYNEMRVGGSGNTISYGKILPLQVANVAAEGPAVTFYSASTAAAGTSRQRIIRVKPMAFGARNAYDASHLFVSVLSRGSAADTQFSITGIKSRIIYAPL